MKNSSVITSAAIVFIIILVVATTSSAQAIEELRGEVEKLGSFEYEDLMSDNAQSLRFSDDCTLLLRMVVDWHDGGEWVTEYRIPLKDIRLDGMMIRQNSLEEPPGLFLETFEESIDVHEEREGTTRDLKQYQVFIRTDKEEDAVMLTAYLRRIIAACADN